MKCIKYNTFTFTFAKLPFAESSHSGVEAIRYLKKFLLNSLKHFHLYDHPRVSSFTGRDIYCADWIETAGASKLARGGSKQS